MKKQLLLVYALLLALSANAQQESPVVLVSAQGKIKYNSPGSTSAQKVLVGAALKSSGSLTLGKNAKALLYCKDHFIELNAAGKQILSTACANGGGNQGLGLDLDFGNYIQAAIEMIAYSKSKGDGFASAVTNPKGTGDGWGTAVTNPKGTGDGWGTAVTNPKGTGDGWGTAVTNPKGTGDGWGGKGSNIALILPFGKVSPSVTTFSWSRPAGSNSYQLEITDDANHSIFKAVTPDTAASIDLAALKLDPAMTYFWTISVSGNDALRSNRLSFKLGKEEQYMNALKKASEMQAVKFSQDATLRKLGEAVSLEKGEWYYAAAQTYAQLQKNNPTNLSRMMHASFWMRYGFRRLAVKAMG